MSPVKDKIATPGRKNQCTSVREKQNPQLKIK